MVAGVHDQAFPLPRSFLLLGQRYVVDSHVFSNVVYDRVPPSTKGRLRMLPDPLDVAFAVFANNQAAKDAALERNRQFHERILAVARWPDRAVGSHILAYSHAPEEAEANSLVGTPDEIMGKLEALRRAGVEYVIMSCGGSRESLRRFAHEIMPTFSDEPAKFKTVPA